MARIPAIRPTSQIVRNGRAFARSANVAYGHRADGEALSYNAAATGS